MTTRRQSYDVAAYIWPSYTGDEPRTRMFWPEGNGEWETVRKAGAKFPGHNWPRRPLWGYCNEADPRVMEMQIDAAADHAVSHTSTGTTPRSSPITIGTNGPRPVTCSPTICTATGIWRR
jgi:hypothetical protein